MNWEIINEIKKIEKELFLKLFKNEKKIENHEYYLKNYYNILENNEYLEVFLNIYKTINDLKNKSIIKKKENLENKINKLNINYDNYNKIKSNKNFLNIFLSIILIKNLSNYSINIEYIDIDNNEENYDKKPPFQTSDDLVNKIKNDFSKFLLYIEIILKEDLEWSESNSRHVIYIILNLMSDKDLLIKKKIWFNKKTYIFFQLKGNFKEIEYFSELYFTPFELYEKNKRKIFQYNYHFSSISEVLKENPLSGEVFIWKDIINFLKKQINENWLYIDNSRLEETINIFKDEYKIELNDVENKYNKLIECLKKSIMINDFKSISELSKKIPQIQTIRRLLSLKNKNIINKKIYIPFFKDFRGRLYDSSSLSLTFYKELRYVVYRGFYEENEKYLEHDNMIIINSIIDKYLNILEEKFKNNNLSIKIKREIIWIIISASEHKKSKIGSIINISTFIEEGIKELENFEKNSESKEIEDRLKLSYLNYIIKDIINNKSQKKWIVSKDATASCFQHLIKTLGSGNEESLKWCNLQSLDTWYDTYKYIIDSFLKNIEIKNLKKEEISKIFNRSTLKRTIMTENYGASKKKCWTYFLNKININDYNEESKKEIENIFNKFYEYISSNLILLKNPPIEINKFILKQPSYSVKLIDGSEIKHEYFIIKKKQIEYRFNNKRLSKKEIIITDKKDIKKMKNAMRANYIQALDAALIRWYRKNNWAVTIHDCFLIDYRNTSFLVAKLNEGMRIIFHDLELDNNIDTNKLFSIFIIL